MKQGIFIRVIVLSIMFLSVAVSMPGNALAGHCPGGTPCVDSNDIIDRQVTHWDIKPNAVRGRHIRRNSITGAKVKDGSLTGADIDSATTLNVGGLNTTGSVGIGTTSPGEKLEVNGDIKIDMDIVFSHANIDIHGPDLGEQYFDFMAGDEGTNFTNDAHVRVWGDKINGRENRFVDIYHNGTAGFIETRGHTVTNILDLIIQGNGGNVGIGTITPQGKLDVNGPIYQRGGLLHADYVFETDYKLESIEEHAEHMWNNKHLKAVPKAMVDENGQEMIEVGSHQRGIVEELEKAHIYIEQLHEQINKLEEKFAKFERGIKGR